MSELKTYDISKSGEMKEYAAYGRYYLKSEVDKVIAEKDAKILALDAEVFKEKHHAKLFFDERNYAETKLRHHKYKRCLGLAAVCFEKSYSTTLVKYDKNSDCLRNFYDWWGKRWLELAELFKEAKC